VQTSVTARRIVFQIGAMADQIEQLAAIVGLYRSPVYRIASGWNAV
jgi:hypothetical protein